MSCIGRKNRNVTSEWIWAKQVLVEEDFARAVSVRLSVPLLKFTPKFTVVVLAAYSLTRLPDVFSHALTGAVQNCDASRVQRAAQLSAENVRVHGTHSPHPQSLQLVWLDWPHAGLYKRVWCNFFIEVQSYVCGLENSRSMVLWSYSLHWSVDSLLLHLLFRLLHLNGKGLESHLILCWEKHMRW